MVGFDLALGSGALLAPRQTLAVLGHEAPTPDAEFLFRRCGPIWLTFAAAHALAAQRGERRDWWALAWVRRAGWHSDALWFGPPACTRPGARAGLWFAGLGNAAMAL